MRAALDSVLTLNVKDRFYAPYFDKFVIVEKFNDNNVNELKFIVYTVSHSIVEILYEFIISIDNNIIFLQNSVNSLHINNNSIWIVGKEVNNDNNVILYINTDTFSYRIINTHSTFTSLTVSKDHIMYMLNYNNDLDVSNIFQLNFINGNLILLHEYYNNEIDNIFYDEIYGLLTLSTSDGIHIIRDANNRVLFAENKQLHINRLKFAGNGKILIVTHKSFELYVINLTGSKHPVHLTLPKNPKILISGNRIYFQDNKEKGTFWIQVYDNLVYDLSFYKYHIGHVKRHIAHFE
jgi:hypothetical protein